MAHDVFISHAKDDKTKADLLCLQLEQAGIRCWIAPRDVRPGRNWGSEIIRGLDNARVMILLLSASSNRSRPVIKEVERAFGKEIVIIPVRLEDVVPSDALEFFLSSDQWFDATTPRSILVRQIANGSRSMKLFEKDLELTRIFLFPI